VLGSSSDLGVALENIKSDDNSPMPHRVRGRNMPRRVREGKHAAYG